MQLAIDIGNTHTFLAFYEEEKCVKKALFKTGENIDKNFKTLNIKPDEIGISSVVPRVNNELFTACIENFKKEPMFVSGFSKHGLKLMVENPEIMGADLIAAGARAIDLCKGENIIIFDMGTTTTVSVITKDKEFRGGLIMPGVETMLKSMGQKTDLLPTLDFDEKQIKLVSGKTSEAMISGAFYASLGAIRGVGKRVKKEYLNAPAVMIGTGGYAHLFKDKELAAFDIFDEMLLVDGIVKIMNAK